MVLDMYHADRKEDCVFSLLAHKEYAYEDDEEMREILERVVYKIAGMTDEEFAAVDFSGLEDFPDDEKIDGLSMAAAEGA